MTDLAEFDPDDPVDAIADLARIAIADAALRVATSSDYLAASPADQIQGYIAGMMTGAMGSIIACIKPGTEGELRATLIQHLPYWFDRALEINSREPLGEIN